eukprot:6924263-Alexandrium_andersonii.AAC.2
MASRRQSCHGRQHRPIPISAPCRPPASSACAEMGSSNGSGNAGLPVARHHFCGGARSPGGGRSPARPWPTARGPPHPAGGSRPSSRRRRR